MRQQTTHGVAGGWWRFAPVLDFDANLNDGWNTFTNRRAEAYSSANRVAAATPLIAPVAYKTTDHRAVLLPQAHGTESGHGHTHGVIDPMIATTDRGIGAIEWTFVILAVTAALQIVVVLATAV